jgi:hypothetical protein
MFESVGQSLLCLAAIPLKIACLLCSRIYTSNIHLVSAGDRNRGRFTSPSFRTIHHLLRLPMIKSRLLHRKIELNQIWNVHIGPANCSMTTTSSGGINTRTRLKYEYFVEMFSNYDCCSFLKTSTNINCVVVYVVAWSFFLEKFDVSAAQSPRRAATLFLLFFLGTAAPGGTPRRSASTVFGRHSKQRDKSERRRIRHSGIYLASRFFPDHNREKTPEVVIGTECRRCRLELGQASRQESCVFTSDGFVFINSARRSKNNRRKYFYSRLRCGSGAVRPARSGGGKENDGKTAKSR